MITQATDFWTPAALAAACNGIWLREPTAPDQPLTGLHTDTRTLAPGQAFLALSGDRFDGHDYLHAAFESGAGLLIVQHESIAASGPDCPTLLVDDTLTALQNLARAYRDTLAAAGVTVVAVAGSQGKTTTRELIHAALSSTKKGTRSPLSFNNHIGVPLTLLGAQLDHDYVLCEVGTNHPGETAFLAELLRPDAACITALGLEHLEAFIDIGGVAREQAQLLPHLRPNGALSVRSDVFHQLQPHAEPDASVHVLHCDALEPGDITIDARDQHQRFTAGGQPFTLPLLGTHNVENALHAITLARWMGLADADTARGLAAAAPPPMRLNIETLPNRITVINDAYNAHPDSMRATLQTLASYPTAGRRLAVLGDMLELGAQSPDLHRAVGEQIAALGEAIAHVVTVGPLGMFISEALDKQRPGTAHPCTDIDAAADTLRQLIKPGDTVLLKASRGVKLERLVASLKQIDTA